MTKEKKFWLQKFWPQKFWSKKFYLNKKIFAGLISITIFCMPLNYLKYNELTQIETKSWNDVRKRCKNLTSNFIYPRNMKGAILVTKDNLTGLFPFVGHAAIILNSRQVIQASPFGGVHYGPNDWDTSKVTCYCVIPKNATQKNCNDAANWAQKQIGKNYNVLFNTWKNLKAKNFYCTQIIWAAYYITNKIDIAPKHPQILFPVNLLNDVYATNLIYYKDAKYE